MDYKKISINGISYGENSDIKDISDKPVVTNVDFRDSKFFKEFEDKNHANH